MLHYFSIKTEKLTCHIDLKEKFYLISGFSGRGKSLFVEEVLRCLEVREHDQMQTDLDVYVITNTTNISSIPTDGPALVICDENVAPKVLDTLLGKNIYCILVTRKVYKHVNMSYKSLYTATRVNEHTYIQQTFNIENVSREYNTLY